MSRKYRTKRIRANQSGFALLLLVGAMGLGSIYMMMRAFNDAAAFGNSRLLKNALVLEEAKASLLMYVSGKVSTETHPGKLPCPEDVSKIGTIYEGDAAGTCSLPAVGRLPWRALKYSQAPLDLDGEQLWYAVSPGFNNVSLTAAWVLNSDTPAGLTVDGITARAVALIISPGRALSGQIRSAISSGSPPAASNYLEGENASLDISFATHGAAGSVTTVFNDQVAIVSHHDLFNVVEPGVARRLSETMASTVLTIKPLISIYASSSWGASSEEPVFPYAVPFGDPSTSTFQGMSGTTQGMLPVTFSTAPANDTQYCNTATDGPRCNSTFVSWVGFGGITRQSGASMYASPAPTCAIAATLLTCTIYTNGTSTITVNVVASASNVAMALRQLNSDAPSTSDFSPIGRAASAAINLDGSATVTYRGRVAGTVTTDFYGCAGAFLGICTRRIFSLPIRVFQDHPITNSSDIEHGWFTSNEWHKLTYYAIAPGFAASSVTRSCTSACLTITNLSTSPNNNKRALLILAGRPIGAQTRPSGTLSNYLESENVSPVDTTFITLKPSLGFNDRVVVVGTN